jgi:hypothetical protein
MGHIVTALALAALLAGCGSIAGTPATSSMARDVFNQPCDATNWVTGVIVQGSGGEAALRTDQGEVIGLVWGSQNDAVVYWGSRYRIGGTWFGGPERFWACAGAQAVIPQ